MAHDLKSPMAPIVGFAQLLERKWDTLTEDERREFAGRIGEGTEKLASLVDDVLQVARLNAGELEFRIRPVDVGIAVATAVNALLEGAASRVHVTLAPELGKALADEASLGRVLTNLVSNALKFSPPDAHVDVSAKVAGDEIVVSVRDRGPGIAPDDVGRLFRRFSQPQMPGSPKARISVSSRTGSPTPAIGKR